jgi:tRNA splicing endonuclease
MPATIQQYDLVVAKCRKIFSDKAKDYGASWRILRMSSITDQIFIKAKRIRTIDSKGEMKVDEGIENEFIGIINYSVIGLIQMNMDEDEEGTSLSFEEAMKLFDEKISRAKNLMIDKNHDYDEAWRDMRTSSFTDFILMKIQRMRQIENNDGKTIASEGAGASLVDIVNYAIFAIIKLSE